VYNEPVIILTLDEVLKEKGKTAYQVAKGTGLHQSVVSKLRRNEAKMIALDVLDRLCDELDCKPSDLIVHQSSKPNSTPQTVKPQTAKVDAEKPASKPGTPQTTASDKDLMTVGEVMSYLGKSESSVLRYIKKYKLLKAEKIGQSWKILRKDVLEFEQSDFYINEAKK
jgi:putative transcriptional regulator